MELSYDWTKARSLSREFQGDQAGPTTKFYVLRCNLVYFETIINYKLYNYIVFINESGIER